jgi:hypothetical protein
VSQLYFQAWGYSIKALDHRALNRAVIHEPSYFISAQKVGLFVMSKPISYYLSIEPPIDLQKLEKYSFYANVCIAQDLIDISSTRRLDPIREAAKLKALEFFGGEKPQDILDMPVTERIQLAAAILITACDRAIENGEIISI